MAIIFTNKIEASGGGVVGTSFATSSWTPANGNVYYVSVANDRNAADPAIPTLSGNGITWTQIDTFTPDNRRITWFRGEAVASSAGALTASFAGQSQLAAVIVIDEAANAALGSNGGAATKQAVKADGSSTGPASVTLAAFGDPVNHATYYLGFLATTANAAVPEAGFTELSDRQQGALLVTSGWRLGADTTPSFTWNGALRVWAILGVEVADTVADLESRRVIRSPRYGITRVASR